jgi:hypothetical protein
MNSLRGLGVCVVVAGIAWAVTQVDVSKVILGATFAIIAVSLSTYMASIRRHRRDYRIAVAPRRRKRTFREWLGVVEVGARIPADLPRVLRLEEWHQPVDPGDTMPSEHETFQQIAEVLTGGDPGRYRPSLPTNTHWSFEPDAGTL